MIINLLQVVYKWVQVALVSLVSIFNVTPYKEINVLFDFRI